MLDFDTLYNALLHRDSAFEGLFIAGIKTTGIFCRPTCPARKPKPENVEFFPSVQEALQQGYRPCKLCRPLEYAGAVPDWLRPLFTVMENNNAPRLKDSDLESLGLNPNRARRWFKKHYGMTLQAYQRALRLGQAANHINEGDKVIEAAFDSGYESLSGFVESFKKATGFTPSAARDHQPVMLTRLLTPLGPMFAGATDAGLCLLEFSDQKTLESGLRRLGELLNAEFLPGPHPHLEKLSLQLEEYFAGTRRDFDLPLLQPGTPFQQKVWAALRSIPYGSTFSYKEEADLLGLPQAVRAVAHANGMNRIAIVVPCHRVIGGDGKLTGYAGGLERKQYLLDLEARYK